MINTTFYNWKIGLIHINLLGANVSKQNDAFQYAARVLISKIHGKRREGVWSLPLPLPLPRIVTCQPEATHRLYIKAAVPCPFHLLGTDMINNWYMLGTLL